MLIKKIVLVILSFSAIQASGVTFDSTKKDPNLGTLLLAFSVFLLTQQAAQTFELVQYLPAGDESQEEDCGSSSGSYTPPSSLDEGYEEASTEEEDSNEDLNQSLEYYPSYYSKKGKDTAKEKCKGKKASKEDNKENTRKPNNTNQNNQLPYTIAEQRGYDRFVARSFASDRHLAQEYEELLKEMRVYNIHLNANRNVEKLMQPSTSDPSSIIWSARITRGYRAEFTVDDSGKTITIRTIHKHRYR
ncbi:MAG: hypothetical protein K2X39_07685 [Silvanigrellaceae bacterium]|nr:hypothetical protein [Silvanigrellaceae bacterium]